MNWFTTNSRFELGKARILAMLDGWASRETLSAGDMDFVDWLFEYWPRWASRNWAVDHGIVVFGRKYLLKSYEFVLQVDPAYCGKLLSFQENDRVVPEGSLPFVAWLRRNAQRYLETDVELSSRCPTLSAFRRDQWHRVRNPYDHGRFAQYRRSFGSDRAMNEVTRAYGRIGDRSDFGG